MKTKTFEQIEKELFENTTQEDLLRTAIFLTGQEQPSLVDLHRKRTKNQFILGSTIEENNND